MIPFGLLSAALQYSEQSYRGIPGAIRTHSRWMSATAYLVRGEDHDTLAFRGSQEPRDWTINIQALPWRYRGAWVHAGFARAHASVWHDICPLIDRDKPLLVTGHSLGGALAELTCLLLDGKPDLHMITMGKPNVFFRPRKARLTHLETQLSVVHGSDLVTHIPRLLFDPDPGQDMLYLSEDGNDYYNPGRAFVRSEWGWTSAISDHGMHLYRGRIERLLEA